MPCPPLWVVERSPARVFLFGETVGLRAGDAWLTDEIRGAVAGSRELWREADREELRRSPLLAEHALSDERLSDRLGRDRCRRVAEVADAVGVDPATLEGLRPWAAGQVLEQAMRAAAGIDGALGVDSVITGLATAAGIPTRSELGDAAATFAWFSGMGRELEIDYLVWTLERVEEGSGEMDRQVAAWKVGDLAVAEEQDAAMARDHPRLHERMIVERNRAWVPRIDAMLGEPGSTFVLVGGAHLVGDHGLPSRLASAGLEPRRLG
jgi:uncharacterized protein YbaP (TraB family)